MQEIAANSVGKAPASAFDDTERQTKPTSVSFLADMSLPSPVEVLGLPIVPWTTQQTLLAVDYLVRRGQPSFFVTANLNYAMLTAQVPVLREVNRRAAFIVADGFPLVWVARLKGTHLPERVTGADLLPKLIKLAAENGYRVFLLGGKPGVAQAVAKTFCSRFPDLKVAGTASPNLDQFAPTDHLRLVREIREARPHLLFVALGQPKGELWLAEYIDQLGPLVAVQLGASFDFVAGTARRAPRWVQRIGLEWFHRMICEPKRLGPRYLRNALFLAMCLSCELARRRPRKANRVDA